MVSEPIRSAGLASLDHGWENAPHPSVILADGGSVQAANRAARDLLPRLASGGELADGVAGWLAALDRDWRAGRYVEGSGGSIGARRFLARPVLTDEGARMWWLEETTALHAAQEELRRERERTEFLRTASDALLSSLNANRTMEVAAELAANRLADAAWVIAPAVRGRHEAVLCVRGQQPRMMNLDIRPDDVPGLAEALQGFPPVPSRWIDPGAVEPWLVPAGFGAAGPVVVTSLPGHGVPAGALVLLRSAEEPAFSEEEEGVARLFASRVGAALSAARLFEEQSAITDVLTSELLPPVLRRLDGIDFAGVYRPAQETARLGGDFYDVHPIAGGALALLGDVCGQGLEAAVLTGRIRNTLQALLPMVDDHVEMLKMLNSVLLTSRQTRFASLVLATATQVGERVHLSLTRAGHLPPLIVRTDGSVEEVFGSGPLVGILPDASFETLTVELAPGETCLLYTDGIVEARGGPMGGEMFGEARLRRVLSQCQGMPAEAVVEHVLMLATQWLELPEHDDMAVLAITAPRARG
ncbi:PP2C family protein-serine/threonine phosphatase [Nocardioides sp. BP30]|uniref:PP2C family protein-serine/threonine phosphatase n=1 Tax=Nocardioides sp. BP30 TaxID=3036374 RepID=UPI0024685649|nr:PP2C family protein-serine/threonine phosphatase [Nocardioides sp. BP30]WGL53385.1 PP2C family protein-serine/threonine phosphatase [Nocardioides sp. BP30]